LSEEEAARWPISVLGNIAVQLLSGSNMVAEPYPRIGSGWFEDDTRYPSFMSQSYNYMLFMAFINDMNWAFGCTDLVASTTYLFRPWMNVKSKEAWMGWQENFKGLCCLAYIYFGYWVSW
jgi:hypothetical protein